MMTPTTSSWNPAAASMPFPSPARMPNPYDTTTRPAPTSRPLPVSSPSQPSASRSDDADADYLAALEASRASEAAARAKRQAEEEETLARISALSLASAQSAAAAAASEEAAMLRSVMNASLQEEEQRRRRQEAEARREVSEAMEASRREDERRRNEEDEVLRRVMRESEQEAARQAEVRRQADEARRLEAEARRLDESQRPELARIQSQRSARPLPPVPQTHGGHDEYSPRSSHDDPAVELSDNDDDGEDDGGDPFADSAEAPPAYENVHSDRPPEAPSRAPTGMWDEVRATNMAAAAAAAAAVADATSASAQQRAVTDPIAEKRRMEALGAQEQVRRTASPEPAAASTSVVADDAAGPSSPEASREKSPTCSTASSGPRTPLGLSWGYSTHPFATSLDQCSGNGSDSSSPSEPSAPRAARFPSTIALASPSMASHTSFTMRSGSWKLLLRALAWLGNTQVAAETPGEARLLIDVEFVTPTHTQQRDHHLHRQKWPTGAPIACVSVSLRLSSPAAPAATAASQQQASRELDSEYLKHGSKRTILSTATSTAGLGLPCTLLDVAQYLSACRAGSSGEESTSSSRFCCSSTPASAVPGLAQRIEEHDGAFIDRGEVRRQIEAAAAAASRSNDHGDHAVLLDCFFSTTIPPGIDRLALLDPPAALLLPPTQQQARLNGGAAGEDEAAYNGDLGLESVDDDNVSTTSRRQRMRDRVRRLYHGDDARRGEATGDGELAHWITPLDLSHVG